MVVAVLPERMESFAYGVVEAPMATRSLVVASVTSPTELVLHPPAEVIPKLAMAPQTTPPPLPVWRALEPVHSPMDAMVRPSVVRTAPIPSPLVTYKSPETPSSVDGLVEPTPTLPAASMW